MNGTDLLAQFRTTRAERAFSGLVQRYTNFVYSIAKRRIANVTLAEEVSQIVFIRLAKTPPKLQSEGQLLGWLHRTTVHVSIDLWRSETRRRAREQLAVAMENDRTEEIAWNEMSPVLDEALDGLDESDRQIILLRFFEQKTMADLARTFDVSEDAAKMRVSRALERLRRKMGGLGVTCGAMLLGTLLFERSIEAAPSGLASTLAAIRIAAPAGFAAGLVNLASGASGAKLASVTVAVAIVIGVAALLLLHATGRSSGTGARSGLARKGKVINGVFASVNSDANSVSESRDPDPAKLLQDVVRARQRIASGIIDFEIFTFGSVTRADDTNRYQLKIQFEGGRLWGETFSPEFGYVTPIPGGPEAEEISKRADQMPREQAIREGLIDVHPTHSVTFYDGQAVTCYREAGDSQPGAGISEPRSSSEFIFDPRCLGIDTTINIQSTLEQSAAFFREAKSITLIGKEPIEGSFAWHVQLRSKYDANCDFWIDALHPTRMLKVEVNITQGWRQISLSRYSDTDFKDPLPIEVRDLDYRPGWHHESRIIRRSTQYNVVIDSACWTLDGLHMKVGTPVADSRNHRRLGYWTGAGLSDEYPSKDQPIPVAANRAELFSLLENEPSSPAGFGAALWFMTNSPDGADVQKAADVILQSHIQSPEMGKVVKDLERMRPNCSSNLLQAILDQNPDVNVRAKACMALATFRKDAAGNGTNATATAEAEKLYERLVAEFGQLPGERGYTFAELAQPELSELRRLTVGKMAPEIVGADLYGQPMKLSDYRGKVVALLFWYPDPIDVGEWHNFRRLVQQLKGTPFALLGIYVDDDVEKGKALAEEHQNWPSFQDDRERHVSGAYRAKSNPCIYVLDRKGVIRYRGLRFCGEVAKAADELLKE